MNDIKYNPTQNNQTFFDIETPVIHGYKKQFSIKNPQGAETEVIEDTTPTQTPTQPDAQQSVDFTDAENNVLLNDGTNAEKRSVTSKYLQKKLGLTKDQAAALVGIWQAESGFNLNAENQAEKAGKSTVKKDEYGIGIGQWTGSRHVDYQNYINSHGGKNNLKTQLDFAIDEISNKYSDYLNNLKSAKSVRDATAYTYAQYVAANERNIKDNDDLYERVRKIEQRYAATHKKLYGKSGSGDFERRVEFATKMIAKLGAKLPNMK